MRSLSSIPLGAEIVDDDGAITVFFRRRWQQLIDSFRISPTCGELAQQGLHAAILTTSLFTTKTAGMYRVGYYLEKEVADGVASSLQVTLTWTRNGTPKTETFAALTTDTIGAQQSGIKEIWSDALSDITIAVAYASTTAGRMGYSGYAKLEQLA